MTRQIRLLLVEDHEVMREALQSLLDSKDEFVVVGEARNGREALKVIEKTLPDVVVMDINLPELNGIETTRQVTTRFPTVKVLALSVHEQGRVVAEMLKAGALGYVPKSGAARELLDAIREIMGGRMYVSPSVLGELLDAQVQGGGDMNAFSTLSDREREVLQLLAEGYSTKEIADKLCLSVPTVHTHRQHLLQKLDARGVADLVRYAIREGIISSDV